jgi:hypothetical protein
MSRADSPLHVYHYQFIDSLNAIRRPEDVFADSGGTPLADRLERVKKAFSAAGWEGDGDIGVIWIPPFVDVGVEDTWGTYLWHVKQANNGTSWIASEYPLPFKRLDRQNDWSPSEAHKLVSILYSDCRALIETAADVVAGIESKVQALQALANPMATEIQQELLLHAQGTLVAQLQSFLDDCYLRVLIEVFANGNRSELKLRKIRATLEPDTYPIEDAGDSEGESDWFNVHGLIGDILRAYKFEPYKEKVDILFRTLEFKPDEAIARELRKHVLLRNCIQHHEGQVTADTLRLAGTQKFVIRGDNGSDIELGAWSVITFSVSELRAFAKALTDLAIEIEKVAGTTIKTKDWEPMHTAGANRPQADTRESQA